MKRIICLVLSFALCYVFPIFQTDKLGQKIRQLPQSIYSEVS